MTGRFVLIVDDEDDIRELLSHILQKAGYGTVEVGTGEEALAAIATHPVDIVLLDLMLPGMDGLTVCRRLKGAPLTSGIPVILLTVRNEETMIVNAFDAGADDYITKPFSPKILLARMGAVLRRIEAADGPPTAAARAADVDAFYIGDLTIDRRRYEVRFGGQLIDLSATEFRVLELLAQRPGWVFSRAQIIRAVHGRGSVVTDRAVDVQVVGLRRKLGPAGECIETVRGFGYRLSAPDERQLGPCETNETLTDSPQPANNGRV